MTIRMVPESSKSELSSGTFGPFKVCVLTMETGAAGQVLPLPGNYFGAGCYLRGHLWRRATISDRATITMPA